MILGASITRLLSVLFSTFLILWINKDMVTAESGSALRKQQESEAKDIYINIMVSSALICIIVLPLIGKLCDTVDPRKIMPFAFVSRSLITYMFWRLTSPQDEWTFVVCVSMVVATITESVCCDSIFMKNLNKETRGIFNGLFSFAGQIGILIFSLAGGWMFDNLGGKTPFVTIGILDIVFVIIFLSFILMQKVKNRGQGTPPSPTAASPSGKPHNPPNDGPTLSDSSKNYFKFDEDDNGGSE